MDREARTRFTDDRLEDKFAAVDRQIDDLPDRVKGLEGKLDNVADDVKNCGVEIKAMHKEFTASRQGLTRTEKIALLGSSAGFIGALAAAAALLAGGSG